MKTFEQKSLTEVINVGGVNPDAAMTQHITVTTAGTPVLGLDVGNPGGWFLTIDSAA